MKRSANSVQAALPSADAMDFMRTHFRDDFDELRGRLAAAVAATAQAANVIIASLEDMIAAPKPADASDRALEALTACAFHDIVGQHMTRAGELLDLIEGVASPHVKAAAAAKQAAPLINGPALGVEDGLDQAEIDKFF